MAGLLAGLVAAAGTTSELDKICLYANAMGAVTASARGAIPSLPDRAAVRAFLTARGHAADLPAAGPKDSS
jgi:fructokinase